MGFNIICHEPPMLDQMHKLDFSVGWLLVDVGEDSRRYYFKQRRMYGQTALRQAWELGTDQSPCWLITTQLIWPKKLTFGFNITLLWHLTTLSMNKPLWCLTDSCETVCQPKVLFCAPGLRSLPTHQLARWRELNCTVNWSHLNIGSSKKVAYISKNYI